MMPLLAAIAFVFYHFTLFSYSNYIYRNNKPMWKAQIIGSGVYTAMVMVFITVFSVKHDWLGMMVYIAVLFWQNKVLLKANSVKAIFGALAFTLNLYAKRLIFVSALTIFSGNTIGEMIADPNFNYTISALAFSFSVPTILIARKLLSSHYMNMILADRQNTVFSINMMISGCLTILASFSVLYIPDVSNNTMLVLMFIGMFCIMTFSAGMSYAYIFADLKMHVSKYEDLSKNISENKRVLKDLEQKSAIDSLTGLRTRESAMRDLNSILKENRAFYLVYMDIDGLKYVNDNIGHNEGDFYIKAIADTIATAFSSETAYRLSGDEFIAIEYETDEFSDTAKVMKCYQSAKDIARKHSREYETSISYGIVNVKANSSMTAEEILSLGDKRMYNVKRAKKKTRTHLKP